jgi:hypothetical protein
MLHLDPKTHPLCSFFLAGYLSKNPHDEENFPPTSFLPDLLSAHRKSARK